MRAGNKTNTGYTIVEVMIFLAISGFMFVLAAIFVSGKQSKAEFNQGMNDAASQISDTINEVTNGFFPSNSDFACTANNTGSPHFTQNAGTNKRQGMNKGCMFLGKFIQFGVKDTDGVKYDIYTVVGRRKSLNNDLLTPGTFAEALPVAADPASKDISGDPPDFTESKALEWGLQVTGMYNYASTDTGHSGSSSEIGAIGFFSSFGNYSGNALESGSQSTIVVVPKQSRLEKSREYMVQQIINDHDFMTGTYSDEVDQPNVVICFKGGRDQKGSITIGGGNGESLSVNMQLGKNVVARCNEL